MNWINVKDSPPPRGKCLVMLEEELTGNRIHSAKFEDGYGIIGCVFVWDAPKVTHWAKLPLEPKEDKENG